jgi:hypothetical protein
LIPDNGASGSWVFETGGAAVETHRSWCIAAGSSGHDVAGEIGRAAYFDVNGIAGRSLVDKYYSENQCGDIDIE